MTHGNYIPGRGSSWTQVANSRRAKLGERKSPAAKDSDVRKQPDENGVIHDVRLEDLNPQEPTVPENVQGLAEEDVPAGEVVADVRGEDNDAFTAAAAAGGATAVVPGEPEEDYETRDGTDPGREGVAHDVRLEDAAPPGDPAPEPQDVPRKGRKAS